MIAHEAISDIPLILAHVYGKEASEEFARILFHYRYHCYVVNYLYLSVQN